MTKKLVIFTILYFTFFENVSGDYYIKGRFVYQDRELYNYGFTGSMPFKPIRFALVRAIDNDTQEILSEGSTDKDGYFQLFVSEVSVRNVLVECISQEASNNGYTNYQVLNNINEKALYSLTTDVYKNHPYDLDIDFTDDPVAATPGNLGEVFNIFDEATNCFQYIESLLGNESTYFLSIFWEKGGQTGSQYYGSKVFIQDYPEDGDGYDDDVIRHEIGHFVADKYSRDDSPGGTHYLLLPGDLRLAWSEGWANFFNSAVKSFHNIPYPEWYVDTSGDKGAGNLRFSFEFETPSYGYLVEGSDYEASVTAVLWDIIDGAVIDDHSPGFDDDPLDTPTGNQLIWTVITKYFKKVNNITIEDFWDGWISPDYGITYKNELNNILLMRGIEYFPDIYEEDDILTKANIYYPDSSPQHHTYYGKNDVDWIKFFASPGDTFIVETFNLKNGANTSLQLFNISGDSSIAYNDNKDNGETLASRIKFCSETGDSLLIKSKSISNVAYYGSYDIMIKTQKFNKGKYKLANHKNSNLIFTISNFGVYGFKNTRDDSEGDGFIFPANTENRLFLGALLIGNGKDRVSDVADNGNEKRETDFVPLPDEELTISDYGNTQIGYAKFSDSNAPYPLNITVMQQSLLLTSENNKNFIILNYSIKNSGEEILDSLIVSLYFDWDISKDLADYENIDWEQSFNLAYQYNPIDTTAPYIGIAQLFPSKAGGFRVIFPESSLKLTNSNKWYYMRSGFEITSAYENDVAQLISSGPFSVNPGDSINTAFAIIGGKNLDELKSGAVASMNFWKEVFKPTDISDAKNHSPEKLKIFQNFPNPFNSKTSIVYELSKNLKDKPVIEIYNIIGQKIKTFKNLNNTVGKHRIVWDGKNSEGIEVSSGVYIYTFKYNGFQLSRKMLILH